MPKPPTYNTGLPGIGQQTTPESVPPGLPVQVPSAHARRLFAAVSSASKRLVLAKGKRQDSLRGSTEYAEALYAFFNEADKK